MARIAGDGDGAAESGGEAETERGREADLPGKARFVPHTSGVFAKPLPDTPALSEPSTLDRPILVRKDGRSRVGRLRLVGGAAVLVLAGWAPEVAESFDRGEEFTLEVSAVPDTNSRAAKCLPASEISWISNEISLRRTQRGRHVRNTKQADDDGRTHSLWRQGREYFFGVARDVLRNVRNVFWQLTHDVFATDRIYAVL